MIGSYSSVVEKREQQVEIDQARNDEWRGNDEARLRRLREDGRRPLGVNLSEGLALSEFLSGFTGSARRS